jgi:hypothetical protein
MCVHVFKENSWSVDVIHVVKLLIIHFNFLILVLRKCHIRVVFIIFMV